MSASRQPPNQKVIATGVALAQLCLITETDADLAEQLQVDRCVCEVYGSVCVCVSLWEKEKMGWKYILISDCVFMSERIWLCFL